MTRKQVGDRWDWKVHGHKQMNAHCQLEQDGEGAINLFYYFQRYIFL